MTHAYMVLQPAEDDADSAFYTSLTQWILTAPTT